jgi:hypothetical protein
MIQDFFEAAAIGKAIRNTRLLPIKFVLGCDCDCSLPHFLLIVENIRNLGFYLAIGPQGMKKSEKLLVRSGRGWSFAAGSGLPL